MHVYMKCNMYMLTMTTGIDVNECAENDTCEQLCTNTDGSYSCGCYLGSVLNIDGHTCSGLSLNNFLFTV